MISARRNLLCVTSANSQANRGRKHADPDKSLQTGLLLIRSRHLQPLINPTWPTVCPKRPKTHERRSIFGLTLGNQRGWGLADRVLTNWSFADGVFADWVLANWRRLDNGLRTREVCSHRCSHQ